MDYLLIILLIYIIIIMIIGFLIAHIYEGIHREMELFQKSFHSMVEDLKVIAEYIEEVDKLLEEYKLLQKYKDELENK